MSRRNLFVCTLIVFALVVAGVTGARAAQTFTYKVTDPLVAATSHAVSAPGTGDVNTTFWRLSGLTTPIGFCVPTTWSIGPDGLTTYPNNGGIGYPALWAFGGNFRVQLFVEMPPNGRTGALLYEYTDLSSANIAIHLVEGDGTPAIQGATPGISYVTTGGGAAYFLFKKQGTTLTIQKGTGTGVNDSSPVVASGPVGADNLFTFNAGVGCPSVTDPGLNLTGFIRVKDFILEADRIVPFPPNSASPPVAWLTGALAIKQGVLTDLVALRATVTDKQDGQKLGEAIAHLQKSVDPSLWIDGSHLQPQSGQKVFNEEKESVHQLRELIRNKKSAIADATIQGFIDRLVAADRILAEVAVGESPAGKKHDQAVEELIRGNADAAAGNPEQAINRYRNGWEHAK